MPFYAAADERIVELQGEGLKVLKALEAVVGHLRKFLVDHSVIPLFEKSVRLILLDFIALHLSALSFTMYSPLHCPFQYNAPTTQERQVDTWTDKSLLHPTTQSGPGTSYPLPTKREPLYLERETQLESQIPSSGISLYGQDPSLSGLRSSGLGRGGAPIVTQVGGYNSLPIFSLI